MCGVSRTRREEEEEEEEERRVATVRAEARSNLEEGTPIEFQEADPLKRSTPSLESARVLSVWGVGEEKKKKRKKKKRRRIKEGWPRHGLQ
ncbi:hypothetical protein C4D60_Mb09t19290 [Musa balbisiana]|uniref:Uncharacterized protein n=1 Tax=Musa balbisiana TaxID=52838 RepID=A0A4S8IHL5_MUSBA|nr:hypothetical protein C4D60_Mb09t19290 [Musa balbisiana]